MLNEKSYFGNLYPDSFWSFSISFRICTLVISKFHLKVLYVAECKVASVFKKEKETKVRQSIATTFNDRDRHEVGECYSRSIISVSVFLVSSYVTCFLAHAIHTLLWMLHQLNYLNFRYLETPNEMSKRFSAHDSPLTQLKIEYPPL